MRALLAEGRFEEAEAAASAWLDATPGGTAEADVLLARGDALVGQNRLWRALYSYEQLLTTHPGSDVYLEAVSRELAIAKLFVGGWKRKLLGCPRAAHRWRGGGAAGPRAGARTRERPRRGRGADAGGPLLREAANGPSGGDVRPAAAELPADAGSAVGDAAADPGGAAQFKGPDFDATGLLEASERLNAYEQAFPAAARRLNADALQQRIPDSLARRDLTNARWYDRRGDRVASSSMRRRLIADYPGTAAAQEAIQTLRDRGLPLVEEGS